MKISEIMDMMMGPKMSTLAIKKVLLVVKSVVYVRGWTKYL